MKRLLTFALFLFFWLTSVHVLTVPAQTGNASALVYRQIAERMIREGEISRECVSEAGGYRDALSIEYESYNRDKIPEAVVVGKAGCVNAANLPFVWIYRKSGKGYQKIYGPVAGDALKQKTITNNHYDIVAPVRGSGGGYENVTFRFDGQRYRSDYSPNSTAATNSQKQSAPQRDSAGISEEELRRRMMRDGLSEEMKGCDEFSLTVSQEKLDLNRDGQPEIVATAVSGCFGARGGRVWIYQKTGAGLKTLLANADGFFKIGNASTRGFRDVTIGTGGAVDVYIKVFKYDGSRYRYRETRRYQANRRGKLILKEIIN